MDTPERQPLPATSWSPPTAPAPATPTLSPRELERTLADQRYLLHLVMGVLVVVLVTTTLGLFQQIRWLVAQAGQLNATSVEVTKAVKDYETNTVPQLTRLLTDFQRFAQTDAEFGKLMSRYRLVLDGGATNGPAQAPPSP